MPIHVKAERIGLLRRVEGLIDEKGEKEMPRMAVGRNSQPSN